MSLLTVVLVIVLLVFNFVSYSQQIGTMQGALEYAVNAGPQGINLPKIGPKNNNGNYGNNAANGADGSSTMQGQGSTSTSSTTTESSNTGTEEELIIDDEFSVQNMSIPVYCVIIDSTKTVISSSTTVFMDSDLLASAISETYSKTDSFGELKDLGLFYSYSATPDGGIRMAFAESSDLYSNVNQGILMSILLGACAFAAFFFISMVLSKIALRPVEEAWDGQQRFIADASHELKTPLTVILANNDIVRAHPESTIEEQERWIEGTHEEALKMQGLVQDLLVLAQTEPENVKSSNIPVELVTINLSDLVEQDSLQFEAVAFESGVEFEEDIAPDLSIKGDNDKMSRVLRVLLDNAIKYSKTSDGGEIPPVKITLAKDRNYAVLKVNNGGKPIDPEDIPHVFDRFFRTDKSRGGETEGFGLGLPIAKNIVDGIGGTIGVESDAAHGTTFTVKVPLA